MSNNSAASTSFSDNQRAAQEYLRDNRVEEILGDMLNTIAHHRFENPFLFMVKYLAKQVPDNLLRANGIIIDSQQQNHAHSHPPPSPLDGPPILQVSFPSFESSCSNMFRQALTRECYIECRNAETEGFRSNLRHIIQLAIENQRHKVGLFATDALCIQTFKPLFAAVHTSLFGKATTALTASLERLEKFSRTTSLNQEFKYFDDFSIKIKRNLNAFPFNAIMSREQRTQVDQTLTAALLKDYPKLFTNSYVVGEITLEQRTILAVNYAKLMKEVSNGFTRTGTRYKDWPQARRIIVSTNKKYLVWVNKEDHFELQCSGGKDSNFLEQLVQSISIAQLLDEKLTFSFDKSYGFFTVKPIWQGLAVRFKIKIKLPSAHHATFKANIEAVRKKALLPGDQQLDIKQVKKDNCRWILSFTRSYAIGQNELIESTEKFIKQLFKSITDKNQPTLILNPPIHAVFAEGRRTEQDEPAVVTGSGSYIAELVDKDEAVNNQQSGIINEDKIAIATASDSPTNSRLASGSIFCQSEQAEKQTQTTQMLELSQSSTTQTPLRQHGIFRDLKRNITTKKQSGGVVLVTKCTYKEENSAEDCKESNNKSTVIDDKEKLQTNSDVQPPFESQWAFHRPRSYELQEQQLQQTQRLIQRINDAKQYEDENYMLEVFGLHSRSEQGQEISEIIAEQSSAGACPCVVVQSSGVGSEAVQQAYIVLRRNFAGMPMKAKMTNFDFSQVDWFIHQLIVLLELDYKGITLSSQSDIFDREMREVLREYALFEDINNFNDIQQQDGEFIPKYGTSLFKSKNLKVIANLDDHLTVILTISKDDVIEHLLELQRILSKLVKKFQMKDNFKYLTRNPHFSGSGLSISFNIREVTSSNSAHSVSHMNCVDEQSRISTTYKTGASNVKNGGGAATVCSVIVQCIAVNAKNLKEFIHECNCHVVNYKLHVGNSLALNNNLGGLTKHKLTLSDCSDKNGAMVALEKSCYVQFREVFERLMVTFNLKETALPTNYSPMLKFKDIKRDVKVSYQMRRNFSNWEFSKYMRQAEVAELHAHVRSVFTELPGYLLKDELPNSSYKWLTFSRNDRTFYVEVMKRDHIGVVSFGNLKDLQNSLEELFNLLRRVQSEKVSFHRDDTLGYLSESAMCLGDNFHMKLELELHSKTEIDLVSTLARECQYEMTVNSRNKANVHNATLELKRCGFFIYEMEFIQRLLFALEEVKKDK